MDLKLIGHVKLFVLFVLLVTGCSSASESITEPEFIVGAWNLDQKDRIEELVQHYPYRSELPLRVELVSEDSYQDRLTSYILSNSSEWDIAFARSEWIPQWIGYHGLTGLNLPESGAIELSDDEQVYALPITYDIPLLFYRTDLFQAAQLRPPVKWDDVYKAAKTLSIPPELYGLSLRAKPEDIGQEFFHFLLGFDAEVNPLEKTIDYQSQESIDALNFLSVLVADGLIAPSEKDDPLPVFQQGRSAMTILWVSQAGELFNCEKSPALCSGGRSLIGTVTIPNTENDTEPSYLQRSQALIIPVGSTQSEKAIAFIAWLVAEYEKDGIIQLASPEDSQEVNLTIEQINRGVSLDPFCFTPSFYEDSGEIIYKAMNGKLSIPMALEEIDLLYQEDINRTSTSRP